MKKRMKLFFCFAVTCSWALLSRPQSGYEQIEKLLEDPAREFMGCSWSVQECVQACRHLANSFEKTWCIESESYCLEQGEMFSIAAICEVE